jgi:NAD(P)-dependent dehydrogenase (short-subunit alcohol dehydrogenase family)
MQRENGMTVPFDLDEAAVLTGAGSGIGRAVALSLASVMWSTWHRCMGLSYGFDRLPYMASKHALVGVSEALAIYLGPKGIGVTCVCPSRVATNIVEQMTTYVEAPPPAPKALRHPIVEAGDVVELVADAITTGSFLVVTAPEVRDELRERASDPEGYLQRLIYEQL